MSRLIVYKALANKDRLRIVDVLKKSDKLNVGEIKKKLKLANSLLSFHLAVLKNAKVVSVKKSGQFRFYSLNKGN